MAPKIVWLHMHPVAAVKRVFTGFVPIVCADMDQGGVAVAVSAKPLHLQLLVPGVLAIVSSNVAAGRPEHILRAALALTELQLAFPAITQAASLDQHAFRSVMVTGCNIPLDIVLQLIAPYLVYPAPTGPAPSPDTATQSAGSNPHHVTLYFNPEETRKQLQIILSSMISLYSRQCTKTIEWFLRAAQLFASAASQADYVSWIVLLAATLEALSKSIERYIEECSNKNLQVNEKDIRRRIVEVYGLHVAGHSVIELRNAIVHGKHSKTGLDSLKAEELIYSNVHDIEHTVTPRTRETLRDFILKQDRYIEKLLNI